MPFSSVAVPFKPDKVLIDETELKPADWSYDNGFLCLRFPLSLKDRLTLISGSNVHHYAVTETKLVETHNG